MVITKKELAISPTNGKPYNAKTQKALLSKKTHKVKSVTELFKSI